MSLWRRLFGPPAPGQPDASRWVVLDVETTGLDTRSSELLAIAAVALHFDTPAAAPHLVLHDSFEAAVLRPGAHADKANILLHGLGVGAQRAGIPAAQVLQNFEAWAGNAPLLAFHAPFDQAIIGRAMKQHFSHDTRNAWLDPAPLAAGLYPREGVRYRSLDDWLQHFGIHCAARHQAAADTLATAELLLRLWPAARAQQLTRFAALAELARHRSTFLHR